MRSASSFLSSLSRVLCFLLTSVSGFALPLAVFFPECGFSPALVRAAFLRWLLDHWLGSSSLQSFLRVAGLRSTVVLAAVSAASPDGCVLPLDVVVVVFVV